LVENGLQAVERGHVHDLIEEVARTSFEDSLDLDQALKEEYPEDARWDYLLGHGASGNVVALEPHSAKNDQISTVIQKRTAARIQLRDHTKDGSTISHWYWVASGRVDFAPTEKAIRLLDQNGITFVGRRLLPKHLPDSGRMSTVGLKRRK
jgi:hypothetical protein